MNTSKIFMIVVITEFIIGSVISVLNKDYRMALYYLSAASLNIAVII